MSTELLPCPFCGTAAAGNWSFGAYFVTCQNNACAADRGSSHGDLAEDVEANAIKAWNTRTTQPQAPQGAVTFGCHCDLEQGFEPDGCVLDEGKPENCVYAMRLDREGRLKESCKYWLPIKVLAPKTETPEGEKP